MLRYLTAGESHGVELTAIIDGVPAGLRLKTGDIDMDLRRRQGGYGRGARQKIESDSCKITSGVRFAKTIGSPVTLVIRNLDWENWSIAMSAQEERPSERREVTRARPGHADLAGALKYGHDDLRNILERSSARETAVRVAVGGVAKALLKEFGISVYSWVIRIGQVEWKREEAGDLKALFEAAENSEVRCPDRKATDRMKTAIDRARKAGDSLGGIFEVVAIGVPPGLGSHVQWDRKLKARLAMALMSIQAIKGVEIGMGFATASTPGSKVHDEIFYKKPSGRGAKPGEKAFWPLGFGFYRKTNNAGGLEGGISNGEPIVLRGAMKPIPTLYSPLRSVDIRTKEPYEASIERSDITAVPAAAIVAEAVAAIEIAGSFLEKFGGDSIIETKRNYKGYLKQVGSF